MRFFAIIIFTTISILKLILSGHSTAENEYYSPFVEKPFSVHSYEVDDAQKPSTIQSNTCSSSCGKPVVLTTSNDQIRHYILSLQNTTMTDTALSHLLFYRQQTLAYLKENPNIKIKQPVLAELQKKNVSFSLRMLDENKQPVICKTFRHVALDQKQHHVISEDGDDIHTEFNGTIKRVSRDRFWIRM
ncbi:hypothetical protein [Candidatus Uabimicrobium amorphum]|uniref:Uncharacterized protein n=1 Tax=Uabimicrobium amorphum TaxID=2596890 RepID=A0A5S9F291_UABAM|nr:hypothetical protein [Candidatus Uabimicrobium amorphum]BBM82144.1 hypothetical protein UABAM_00487 [Candidatus Uabimicrobium amorphum]